MTPEPITWTPVAEGLPDAEMTCLIELDPASDYSEPTFMGFMDGEVWRDVHGAEVRVIAWANMPLGSELLRTAGMTPARTNSTEHRAWSNETWAHGAAGVNPSSNDQPKEPK